MKFSIQSIASMLALFAVVLFSACKKSDDSSPAPTQTKGQLEFYFQQAAGDSEDPIVYDSNINTDTIGKQGLLYKTANGDSITFGSVRYWVSNVKLGKADGTWWSEDSSYHLVQQGNGITEKVRFMLKNVPSADYTKIKFSIGVDSIYNFDNTKSIGDLKVGLGMNWDWSTGYIFLKFDGQFKKPNGSLGRYYWHQGNPPRTPAVLWSDPNSNLKNLTYDLPTAAKVSSTVTPNIHMMANVLAPFGFASNAPVGGAIMDVKDPASAHGGFVQASVKTMNNVKGMFRVDHVHND